MKKYLPLVVVGWLVLCGLGAVAVPFDLEKIDISSWEQMQSPSPVRADVLDQQQPLMDFFGPIGRCPLVSGVPNYIIAQTFTPTKPVLTRVELMIGKNSTTTYDYIVTIRDALDGADLASTSIPAEQIITENFSWIEFDFTDISVSPGNTYYIVSSTENVTDNWYSWGLSLTDTYLDGTIYYTINDGVNWSEEPDGDMTFKTYGRDNLPPNEPLITGETDGKVGIEYTYNFSTDDLDGDNVYYWIEWGDNSSAVEWTGPYASGMVVTVKHTFTAKGTYTIEAKAKDTVGAESPWGHLEVTMPKSSAFLFNFFLQQIFERYPRIFPILRHLLGY
jgi:hypothetical protein